MRVPKKWLSQLVQDLNLEEVEKLLPLRSIGTKEITPEFIELDMKGYNRADLLSMRGVAQEVAAITNTQVTFTDSPSQLSTDNKLQVEILNQDLCPFYAVAKIEGLKVVESSQEWKEKLTDSGMRPVNNLADITNLVMLEYGQPLHAFDASNVSEEKIVVRTARENEELVTLDDKKRQLTSTDLLIADPKKALGLAGVMGGKDSEVKISTQTILLEAAIFDSANLRRTVTRLNLPSEASKRFIHGLTKVRLLQALEAAIKMYEGLGGKLTGLTIVDNLSQQSKTISLSLEKANSLIGIDLKPQEVEEYLKKLGFAVTTQGGLVQVTPPYWRLDIEIEEDLIEEVARMYGYEKIPAKALIGEMPQPIDQSLFTRFTDLKNNLVGLGLTEVQSYSFYTSKVLEALGVEKEKLVKVSNPMSAETEYLRENIWPNLVEFVDKNLRQGFGDIAIFEIGKVYQKAVGELPKEQYRLAIALMNGSDNPLAELYQLAKKLSLNTQQNSSESDLFHPTRYLISVDEGGVLAEVHPRVLDKLGLNKRVAVLEITI